MTDPTGEVFLSYNHQQKDLAVELDRRLREHGVPVWRDERKIGPDPLESQIESVLQSEEISGAILLLSEDILDSPTILNVEIPQIHARYTNKDTFFTFVLRCPGLSAGKANEILSNIDTINNFSEWFFHALELSEEDSPNFNRVVDKVIQRRLDALVNIGNDSDTIRCSINSYQSPNPTDELWFHADISNHFEDNRLPGEKTWNHRIGETITRLTNRLAEYSEDREIEFMGRTRLPIAFAVGCEFPTTRGIHAKWTQQDPNFNEITWDVTVSPSDAELSINSTFKDSSKTDLAIYLSLTDDVRPEVGNTASDLPDFNTEIEIKRTNYDQGISPKQGVKIANEFQKTVRDELNTRSNIETIHLFQSSPVGLSFLLGQHTNTLPPIQTYAFNDNHQPRRYEPAILIQ
ncbi:hypothetical protein C457_11161 [Haloferax prahovense DSM 18310]|uniref:SMODS-associated and fused to various effectors domain-containing protein n=1 Tax=Haloferax prahovense (strain DSM 18310 / JCM 13924 / TL6) TaxID=1227461 RepID=M0GCN3_HALPT|nr:SAVED domain-containing protein [Haloferax prahovense]ELZ68559.1 hypothetical protein C457_11161 [Haloferax prahovense DSM 18310]